VLPIARKFKFLCHLSLTWVGIFHCRCYCWQDSQWQLPTGSTYCGAAILLGRVVSLQKYPLKLFIALPMPEGESTRQCSLQAVPVIARDDALTLALCILLKAKKFMSGHKMPVFLVKRNGMLLQFIIFKNNFDGN
jgi:hypothetical protein